MFKKIKRFLLGDPAPTAQQWINAIIILAVIAVAVFSAYFLYVYSWLHKTYL